VTDYDCWKAEHCTLEEIMKVMGANNKSAQQVIKLLVASLGNKPVEFQKENEFAVVTKKEAILPRHQEILKVLLS
ncbi:MAG: S-methyl-5'-thioadenosine phosphorylase, partial [Bacteriovoracaceae bacterium]